MTCGKCECGRDRDSGHRLCSHCRMRRLGESRRKYHFSDDLRNELREAYCNRKRGLTNALDRLERKTGWPRHAFKVEAQRLGIITADHRRNWTPQEEEYLREHIGRLAARRIANHLNRSVSSVVAKTEKMKLSRRPAEGYCMQDLQQVFGESHHKVRRWMERGLLGRISHHGGRRVSEVNLMRFLRIYSSEYDLRRVDQAWYKAMVFGESWGSCL